MGFNLAFKGLKRFKEGRMSVGEDPKPGRLCRSTNDDHVERLHAVICGNRRLTVRGVADEVFISIGSYHQICTEKKPAQMRRVSSKFVPRLLSDDQKENRFEIGQELFVSANGNENSLKNFQLYQPIRCSNFPSLLLVV
jgi:hypothetical protein